jgi:hypothetical protein
MLWDQRVRAYQQQSVRARELSGWTDPYRWKPLVGCSKAGPCRKDDPVVARLLSLVAAQDSLLDVGGGAGSYALPLALKCRRVSVVGTLAAMLQGPGGESRRIGLNNVSPVSGNREDVDAERADVVLCANVVYDLAGIATFVERLAARANRQVLVLAYDDAPANQLSPFWGPVYGEQRVDLPGAPELLRVLDEMGIRPEVEVFDPDPPESVPNIRAALDLLRNLLFVRPDTVQDRKLQRSLHGLLEETPAGVTIKESRPRRLVLMSWPTGRD